MGRSLWRPRAVDTGCRRHSSRCSRPGNLAGSHSGGARLPSPARSEPAPTGPLQKAGAACTDDPFRKPRPLSEPGGGAGTQETATLTVCSGRHAASPAPAEVGVGQAASFTRAVKLNERWPWGLGFLFFLNFHSSSAQAALICWGFRAQAVAF